ncbi:hypothetical protein CDAR_424431 [Caerostris darwini]|uniref:Uncharacterized protein n=1 Tax=Caerostris darwini TaxID=1538125 RepID=A0AAV4T0F9_9ARAC|nr:hypothetical protein CDAR_424431 [Caerostris darwini]
MNLRNARRKVCVVRLLADCMSSARVTPQVNDNIVFLETVINIKCSTETYADYKKKRRQFCSPNCRMYEPGYQIGNNTIPGINKDNFGFAPLYVQKEVFLDFSEEVSSEKTAKLEKILPFVCKVQSNAILLLNMNMYGHNTIYKSLQWVAEDDVNGAKRPEFPLGKDISILRG